MSEDGAVGNHAGGPWLLRMQWRRLLFVHWPVDAVALQRRLPPGLDLDTYQGRGYIGVVPFAMRIAPRGVPYFGPLTDFPEINVRTYVRHRGGRAGVFFFSLDVPGALAVWVARTFFHLPYFTAKVACGVGGAGAGPVGSADGAGAAASPEIHYKLEHPSRRFCGTYGAAGAVFRAQPGSFAHWATERYCLYSTDGRGGIFRGDIAHRPWPLQPARAGFEHAGMVEPFEGLGPQHPEVFYSEALDVWAAPIRRV